MGLPRELSTAVQMFTISKLNYPWIVRVIIIVIVIVI